MSKQAIEQIRAAEQAAKNTVADAQRQADAIVRDCENEIEKQRAAHVKLLEQKRAEALSEADKKIGGMWRGAEERARKNAAELKKKYDALQSAAAELAMAEALK